MTYETLGKWSLDYAQRLGYILTTDQAEQFAKRVVYRLDQLGIEISDLTHAVFLALVVEPLLGDEDMCIPMDVRHQITAGISNQQRKQRPRRADGTR